MVVLAGSAGRAEDGPEVKSLKDNVATLEQELLNAKRALAEKLKTDLAERAKGSGDITKPQFLIPKKTPVIDGVVNDEEWAGCVGVPITTGIFGMMERPSSYFWLGWDEENFYVAQRLPMREGEKPLRCNREPKHDNVHCSETSIEVYVDRKEHGSHGSKCRYQFMGNAVGNQWDREDQYEIGQNFIGWDGEWQYKQRLTPDGKFWEAEIAIPRKTVYQKEPLKNGDLWWIGLATNLHRPMCFSGFYGWKIAATFVDSVPEIRLFYPERGLPGKRMSFDMTVRNTTGQKFEGSLIARLWGNHGPKGECVTEFEKTLPVSVEPGMEQKLAMDEAMDQAKDGIAYTISIMVVKPDGKSVYTWSYPIKYNIPENKAGLSYEPDTAPFPMAIAYNPLSNYVRVAVDKYDMPNPEMIKLAKIKVVPEGKDKILATGQIDKFEFEKGQTCLPVPADLDPGKYDVAVELVDKEGKLARANKMTFERKDHAREFPWLNSKIGEDDVLLRPFTPLSVDDDIIHAYKKEITLNGVGLPAKIKSADVELLASAVELRGVSDGKPFVIASSRKTASEEDVSETVVEFTGKGSGGPLSIKTKYRLEYDGTAKITLTMAPAEDGKKAKLDSLQLVIPFTKAGATHMMANGMDFRLSNMMKYVPEKLGVVWTSKEVPYQKMTVGSFVPIVFLGNLSSGITWFAASDKGWWPSDAKPATEIVRTAEGPVEMIFNLASESVEFVEPREIVFGLHVAPSRPISPYRSPTVVVSFGGEKESGRWDPEISKDNPFARLYPDNIKKFKEFVEAHHKYNEIILPYTEQSPEDYWKHELAYFQEEWRSDDTGGVIFCESGNDNRLWWTEKWIKDADIDGYYMDNVCARYNANDVAGNAYRLPDGRIQPGYDLWELREYVKRLRTIFQKHRPQAMICIHNTEFQFAPIMAFADLAMGGEMPMPTGGSRDFMDMYPRPYMDLMYNVPLWGYQLSNLYHFNWDSFKDEFGEYDATAALKAHRTAMATSLVHGMEFFQGIEYKHYLMAKFMMLKKLPGQFEFIPSWQANGLFKIANNDPEVDVAVYKKDDVLLVILCNYAKSQKNTDVWLDFPKLIRPPANLEWRAVLDFETLEFPGWLALEEGIVKHYRCGDFSRGHNTMFQPNTLRVPVEPRDFRALLFINVPVAKGAGF